MSDLFADGWDDIGSDDLFEPELAGAAWVSCPHCGESVELIVDPTGGAVQVYVEDCEVCCRPWSVRVTVGPRGEADVSVAALDSE